MRTACVLVLLTAAGGCGKPTDIRDESTGSDRKGENKGVSQPDPVGSKDSPRTPPVDQPGKVAIGPGMYVGDTVFFAPGSVPMPWAGYQLALTKEQAKRAERLFDAKDKDTLVTECDGRRAHFIRCGTLVKVIGKPDGDGVVHVRVESGTQKGKTGYLTVFNLGPSMTLPEDRDVARKYPEPLRKKVFERHMRMVSDGLDDGAKEVATDTDPTGAEAIRAKRSEFELAALPAFVRRFDAALAEFKINQDDWAAIVRTGMSEGWGPDIRDR